MALRNILNQPLCQVSTFKKLKPGRYFSSKTIREPLYKASLPLLSTPWLILPPDIKDGPKGPTDNYFNILDKTMVKIDRQLSHGNIPRNTICLGTAQGWIAFNRDYDNSIFLAHPYKEGCSIKLPSFPFDIFRTGLESCTLVRNPVSKNFALLALQDCERDRDNYGLHIGNEKGWRKQKSVPDTESILAYNRTGNSVYRLQWWKKLGPLKITCLDVMSDISKVLLDFKDPFVDGHEQEGRVLSSFMDRQSHKLELNDPWNYDMVKYLVVGEEHGKSEPVLFLVIRHVENEEGVGCKTKGIKLLRIDLEKGKVEYVRSLGDKALFLGTNSEPFFVSTTECPGLKSNSVYIADDLGVYDLETKCVTSFLSLGDFANIRPQVYWLAPRSFN